MNEREKEVLRIEKMGDQIQAILSDLKSKDEFLDKKSMKEIRYYFPILISFNFSIFFNLENLRIITIENSDVDFSNYENYEINKKYLSKCISYLYFNCSNIGRQYIFHIANFKNNNWTIIFTQPGFFLKMYFFKIDYQKGTVEINEDLNYLEYEIKKSMAIIKEINHN